MNRTKLRPKAFPLGATLHENTLPESTLRQSTLTENILTEESQSSVSHVIYATALYDTKYVANRYQLCPRTLENWRTTGRGPSYVKIGRLVRYKGASLLDWEDRNTLEHSGQGVNHEQLKPECL